MMRATRAIVAVVIACAGCLAVTGAAPAGADCVTPLSGNWNGSYSGSFVGGGMTFAIAFTATGSGSYDLSGTGTAENLGALTITGTVTCGAWSSTIDGSATGQLNGSMSDATDVAGVFHASNSSGSDSGTWSLTTTVIALAPTITNAPQCALVNAPFSEAFSLTGIPAPTTTVTTGALPPGLSLSSDGLVSGTPTTLGSYSATVTATNGNAPDATISFTLKVKKLCITNTSLPNASRANSYSATLAAVGGVPPYVFSKVGGSLPPGITFHSGAFSGTPTARMVPKQYVATYSVHDSSPGVHLTTWVKLAIIGLPDLIVSDLENQQVVAMTDDAAGGTYPQRTLATPISAPNGVAMDAKANLYVSDEGTGQVDKIAPDGTKTVIIKNLNAPSRLAVDTKGDVVVTDTGNGRVIEKKPGLAPVAIGSGFVTPVGIAFDSAGNVYVGDTALAQVIKVATNGTQTVLPMSVSEPNGVAVDAAGDVFAADWANNHIDELTAGGAEKIVPIINLAAPNDVAVDSYGDLFVADHDLGTVVGYLADGTQLNMGFSNLWGPNAVAVG